MRRVLLAGASMAALSGGAQAQGITVHDPASLIEEVEQLAAEAKAYSLQVQQSLTQQAAWAKQGEQYAMQAQQYETEAEQLLAFVHNPNLGNVVALLNQAGLGSSMPVNPEALLGVVYGARYGAGGLPEIQGILGSLSAMSAGAYAANHVYSPADNSWASQQLVASGNSIAGTQGAAAAAFGDLKVHSTVLAAIREHLATATTPKDVQDAQAQIELENTWSTNQQAQLVALQASYAAQQDSRIQRDEEKMVQSIDDEIAQAKANGAL